MSFCVPVGKKFDTAGDIQPFIEQIEPKTKTVNFGGSSYGVEATKAIAEKLATLEELEVANFDDMFTGRDGPEIAESMTDILGALLGKPSLHTIDLSDNAFGIVALAPLTKFLAEHAPLEHLIFANNGFGPHSGSNIGAALVELAALKQKTGAKPLRTVVCGRNRLEAGSMANWAKFLKAHGTVETLRLYQNGIRPEGIEQLMREGLKYSPNLRHLDLTDNTFTLRGCRAMAEAIGSWPALEELAVSDCLLRTEGTVEVALRIRELQFKKLERVRLQYNEIDAVGLEALKDSVRQSIPELQLLELNGNWFQEDHELVAELQALFEERGHGELDELDDMEEPDSDAGSDSDLSEDAEPKSEAEEDEEPDSEDSEEEALDDLAKRLERTSV